MWGDERVVVSGDERIGPYTDDERGADAERKAGPALENDDEGRAYVWPRPEASAG